MTDCYKCEHFTEKCECAVRKNKKDSMKVVPSVLRSLGQCDFFKVLNCLEV